MPLVDAVVECPVHDSFRVQQVAGMFDLQLAKRAKEQFSVEVPSLGEDWRVGAIVGPSGSGKSTIARQAFGESVYECADWPGDRAVIDCFGERSIRDITHVLTAVGFSSPPAWVKPYAVLSNGERFRCNLARSLLTGGACTVFDEFTSVVDRTVARIASAAVSKAIRRGLIDKRFVAVTCHYDVLDWLEPDWIVDMAVGELTRRCLRRPDIRLDVYRCERQAWGLFEKHHYLSRSLHRSAACYLGVIEERPAALVAVLHAFGRADVRRI